MLGSRFKYSAVSKDDMQCGEQEELFEQLEASFELMGDDCEPLWLKERRVPNFASTVVGENGPTVLLLHGLFGAMSNWDDFLPIASRYARLHALSFPLLTGNKTEVKVKALALFTECYIRTHCQTPVVLCGNSLGGHVALRVALAHPEMVDCLILSASSGLYERTANHVPMKPSRDYLRGHLEKVFYNQKFVTEERLDEVVEVLKKRSNHLNIVNIARSAKHDNLQNELKKIQHQTLLLWGANDEVTPLEVAEEFNELIPHSELKTKDSCGHAPMIEHPAWFSEQMEPFLRKYSKFYL